MNRAQLVEACADSDDEFSSDIYADAANRRHLNDVATRLARSAGLRVRFNYGEGTPPPLRSTVYSQKTLAIPAEGFVPKGARAGR